MKLAVLNGKEIHTENDVHRQLYRGLELPEYYGNNLNALWDCLTVDVERPARVIWNDSQISRERLGEFFEQIVKLFQEVKEGDLKNHPEQIFDYELR